MISKTVFTLLQKYYKVLSRPSYPAMQPLPHSWSYTWANPSGDWQAQCPYFLLVMTAVLQAPGMRLCWHPPGPTCGRPVSDSASWWGYAAWWQLQRAGGLCLVLVSSGQGSPTTARLEYQRRFQQHALPWTACSWSYAPVRHGYDGFHHVRPHCESIVSHHKIRHRVVVIIMG